MFCWFFVFFFCCQFCNFREFGENENHLKCFACKWTNDMGPGPRFWAPVGSMLPESRVQPHGRLAEQGIAHDKEPAKNYGMSPSGLASGGFKSKQKKTFCQEHQGEIFSFFIFFFFLPSGFAPFSSHHVFSLKERTIKKSGIAKSFFVGSLSLCLLSNKKSTKDTCLFFWCFDLPKRLEKLKTPCKCFLRGLAILTNLGFSVTSIHWPHVLCVYKWTSGSPGLPGTQCQDFLNFWNQLETRIAKTCRQFLIIFFLADELINYKSRLFLESCLLPGKSNLGVYHLIPLCFQQENGMRQVFAMGVQGWSNTIPQ